MCLRPADRGGNALPRLRRWLLVLSALWALHACHAFHHVRPGFVAFELRVARIALARALFRSMMIAIPVTSCNLPERV